MVRINIKVLGIQDKEVFKKIYLDQEKNIERTLKMFL